ncbi:MAG: 30S ribosomal protein S8 [Planctomycetes bacterium]|nr:30S ribosomal protein S8 [Planctomycetota bacterium]MCC7399172.1 30S ribosomal protein S8 [Planctomycetota bacterium]
MMTDPIADMLTRMRNALMSGANHCIVPGSRLKVGILDALKREGFIDGYQVAADGPRSVIRVEFRFGPDGERVITSLARFSRPGCRRYRACRDLPQVRGGLGIAVVSTNQGVLSDRECRVRRVGGEVLCTVD